jgi:5-oxoprolinase (ATP-hydrolysing)
VNFALDIATMRQNFEAEHKTSYGFIQLEKNLVVESVSVELIQQMDTPLEPLVTRTRSIDETPIPVEAVQMFTNDKWYNTPVYQRDNLQPGDTIRGSAIIVEKISTIVIEPDWEAKLTERNHLILERMD